MEPKFNSVLSEYLHYRVQSYSHQMSERKQIQYLTGQSKQFKLQLSDTYDELLMNKQQAKNYWQKLFWEELRTNPGEKKTVLFQWQFTNRELTFGKHIIQHELLSQD